MPAQWKHQNTHQTLGHRIGEIIDGAPQRLLEPVKTVGSRKGYDRPVALRTPVILEPFQHTGQKVKLRKRVREPAGEFLFRLQSSTQKRNRQIRDQSEIPARTR